MIQFGKYLLQRRLAQGGMAEVFLARQTGMGGFEKPVVIKRILPHLSGEAHFVEMFLNEARVAARLTHPAIAQIFDFGRIDGQYFLAMEFVHGEDLRNLARVAERAGGRPPPEVVARIVADTLGGLHYAHTRLGPDGRPLGLVHRDVSPQNVLVTFDGGVKIVDFGIAKATVTPAESTQSGLLKGKYAYMSPEQCRGLPLDARSDVFSMGILLWELLTFRRLFKRDTDLATMVAVADEAVPPPRSFEPALPAELDRICARALSRSIAERYPSAQAMQADLEALIRASGWEADSIRLQQYMRDLFAEKLAREADAIRNAGVASIEDFLVRADDATLVAADFLDAGPDGGTPSGRTPRRAEGTPRPIGRSRSGRIVAGRAGGSAFGGEVSATTLGRAAGQRISAPPPPAWKRAAVILGTGFGVAALLLSTLLRPVEPPPPPLPASSPLPVVAPLSPDGGTDGAASRDGGGPR